MYCNTTTNMGGDAVRSLAKVCSQVAKLELGRQRRQPYLLCLTGVGAEDMKDIPDDKKVPIFSYEPVNVNEYLKFPNQGAVNKTMES